MENKHLKRYSPLNVRETTIKTTMAYHYTPIRVARIWNTDNTKCWQRCEAKRTLSFIFMGMQNGTLILKDSLAASYKTILLPFNLSVMSFDIYTKRLKTSVHTEN